MYSERANRPTLGMGIYTIPDMALIFRLPNWKVNRWVNKIWDEKLGKEYKTKYSWNIDLTRAVNFYTLVELHTFYQLNMAGVKSTKILEAHKILSNQYSTKYPFAKSQVLRGIRTEGRYVLFDDGKNLYSLDATLQFNLDLVRQFFKNLDFDDGNLASRFWPIGKNKSIVCDPHHQFGQPIIEGTNVLAETIFEMHQAGDSVKFLANTYRLKPYQIEHAIEYAREAA